MLQLGDLLGVGARLWGGWLGKEEAAVFGVTDTCGFISLRAPQVDGASSPESATLLL